VWFSDTDAQGVVYYGRYMPYFDLSRTEYHRHLLGSMRFDNVDFAMRAISVEYVAPARFDDLLEIFVRVERIGRTSITFEHAAYRLDEEGDTLMATAKATAVCIALDERRAVPVPDEYRAKIEEFEGAVSSGAPGTPR
jgi:acyl-CoA thioester hydrolase